MATVTAIIPPVFGTTWITAPDDGVKVLAAHVRQLAEICFTNEQWLYNRVSELNPAVWGFGEDGSTKVWTTVTIDANGAHIDVPGCVAGQVLVISASAHVNIRDDDGSSPSASGGAVYLYTTQQYGGGVPVTAAAAGNRRGISADASVGATSVNMAFDHMLEITSAGTCRVELRGTVNNADDKIQLLDWAISVQVVTPT